MTKENRINIEANEAMFKEFLPMDLMLKNRAELLKKLRISNINFEKVKIKNNVVEQLDASKLQLFKLEEITYEENAPRREAVENILGICRKLDNLNLIYIVMSKNSVTSIYFGLIQDFEAAPEDVNDFAEELLKPAIMGNFKGSKIRSIIRAEKDDIINFIRKSRRKGIIDGVPSIDRQPEQREKNYQSVDRLINSMYGTDFALVIIANPIPKVKIEAIEHNLYSLHDDLTNIARYSIESRVGKGTTEADNYGLSASKNTSEGFSEQHSTQNSTSKSDSISSQNNESNNIQYSIAESSNKDNSHSNDASDGESHTSGSRTTSGNENTSDRVSYSINNNINSSYSKAFTSTTATSNSTTHDNSSDSVSKSTSSSIQSSKSNSKNYSSSIQLNDSLGNSTVYESKEAIAWLKYIDEILLPRIDNGYGKGLFDVCIYLYANESTSIERLANSAISLYSGPQGNRASLQFTEVKNGNENLTKALSGLQISKQSLDKNRDTRIINAQTKSTDLDYINIGSWMSAEELALLVGVPQKEVIGVTLREEVEFGLNITREIKPEEQLELGTMVQSGVECKKNIIYLNRHNLDKHTFVTGVTGSGKTTTCQTLLLSSKLPFLVIEPAKTEYRVMLEEIKDMVVFTPGKMNVAPFFINPFEFLPGSTVSGRVEMLKATMEASFDMEAAIPQILEAAMYDVYQQKGWNIRNNTWRHHKQEDPNGPFAPGVNAFPTLDDFTKAVEANVRKQNFGERLRDEYLGSIRARLQSLTVGIKGLMFNTKRSINFLDLIDRKVVIELDELKGSEEKTLLMGFILTNLLEAVKIRHEKNPNFQHITLVEEAHRLLSRYMPGDSMNKKQGVQVFTDMLAEVRKYGESLIIVDQIPDKMTPEVLKNTNTKIVHKLFAKDDKDCIGDTIALRSEQKNFLSNLPCGRAIVFSQDWQKAIQVQVKQFFFTTGDKEISTEVISDKARQYYMDTVNHNYIQGLDKLKNLNKDMVAKYLDLVCEATEPSLNMVLSIDKTKFDYINSIQLFYPQTNRNDIETDYENIIKSSKEEICNIIRRYDKDLFTTFFRTNIYDAFYRKDEEIFVQAFDKKFPELIDNLHNCKESEANAIYEEFIKYMLEKTSY